MKQIIACGGGGFSHRESDLSLEKYILAQVSSAQPKVAFLPQASHEDPNYCLSFFSAFTSLGAKPSVISLFGRVDGTFRQTLLQQDVIYVGGGNTRSMLALWREWGVDASLRQAYDSGILLCGVSAGAICWFEQGITDSVWPLGVLDCLGILEGSLSPHFDTEIERQPFYREGVSTGKVKPGYALDDFTALHYKDGELAHTLTSKAGRSIRHLTTAKETLLSPTLITL